MRPPGATAPNQTSSLTDLSAPRPRRNRIRSERAKATDRMTRTPLHRRVRGQIKSAGVDPQPYMVESIVATLVANHEEPTQAEIIAALMKAPWWPKPSVRRYRVGEAGWRTRS